MDTPRPTLPSFDDQQRLWEFRWVERNRKILRRFDPVVLCPQQRVYREIIDCWFLDMLAGERFFDILPVTSEQEARNYLTLLTKVPAGTGL